MEIPECVHPLSKYWDQPKNAEIEIDDLYALMSEESFEQLYEYSMSVPTGAYAGKMWKARNRLRDVWYLRWYEDDSVNNGMCLIQTRMILVVMGSGYVKN